ncbi:PspA/IM30 family protein [Ectobacillus ponti]|uniref:PspA/IM30 family protein n=1 Tax=Ectobacillus ponti TaxID=2961894 RepID=A0AA41X9B7_9BACI|nr:PspA/IM30 family protein [Ectobacillus ponti]MCP8968678.1 PspA/IM30 family protein [Ectobacillus ponti]
MKTSLFQRIRSTFLADMHELLDEKERQNPIALLNQYLRDSEQEVKRIEKLISRQQQLRTQFFRELEQARYMEKKRRHQAEVAFQAGEAALQERALQEMQYYAKQAAQLEEQHTRVIEQTEDLQQKLEEMKNRLKELHAKRLELMARENAAHAHRRIHDAMHKVSDENPFLRFSEIEEQIRDLEMRITADYERDTFDYKIARLEKQLKEKETVQQEISL